MRPELGPSAKPAAGARCGTRDACRTILHHAVWHGAWRRRVEDTATERGATAQRRHAYRLRRRPLRNRAGAHAIAEGMEQGGVSSQLRGNLRCLFRGAPARHLTTVAP